jgi:hypothetical protein
MLSEKYLTKLQEPWVVPIQEANGSMTMQQPIIPPPEKPILSPNQNDLLDPLILAFLVSKVR